MTNLGAHFLEQKTFREHHSVYEKDYRLPEGIFPSLPPAICFKDNPDAICFGINPDGSINNSYYVGLDWCAPGKAVYVQSKMNDNEEQLDLTGMLFDALKNPEVIDHLEGLYIIKWDSQLIKIHQQQDLLTPLLILQFLQVVKSIVKKGLKKSYYTVHEEFNGRVKGKLDVALTIKRNLSKGRLVKTNCVYQQFGFNGTENKILKKALLFVQRYLTSGKGPKSSAALSPIFNYIMPAFVEVDDQVSLEACKSVKINPFYKEYKTAVRLALEILKRFGYNLNNTVTEDPAVPPFWIDMSKLFELYVLGLLRNNYGQEIRYGKKQAKANYGLPDYLYTRPRKQLVIDAKYKLMYNDLTGDDQEQLQSRYEIDNVRQLAAYARDVRIYQRLGLNHDEMIKCLIIYPEKMMGAQAAIDLAQMKPIKQFVDFYKLSVRLPALKTASHKFQIKNG